MAHSVCIANILRAYVVVGALFIRVAFAVRLGAMLAFATFACVARTPVVIIAFVVGVATSLDRDKYACVSMDVTFVCSAWIVVTTILVTCAAPLYGEVTANLVERA